MNQKQIRSVDWDEEEKEHDNYIRSMVTYSKMLKDREHLVTMEIAKEEHAIKMAIHHEALKAQKRNTEMAEEEHALKMAILKAQLKKIDESSL